MHVLLNNVEKIYYFYFYKINYFKDEYAICLRVNDPVGIGSRYHFFVWRFFEGELDASWWRKLNEDRKKWKLARGFTGADRSYRGLL